MQEIFKRAIGEAGVAFVPGRAFFHDGGGANMSRLSYSLPDASGIVSA